MPKVRPQSANSLKFSRSRTVDSEQSGAEKSYLPKFLKSSSSFSNRKGKSECEYKLLEQSEALLSAFDEEEEFSDQYRSESEEDRDRTTTTRIDMKLLNSSTVSKCEGKLERGG